MMRRKRYHRCRKMKRASKRKYGNLTLLGNAGAAFPDSPAKAKLETFRNPYPNRDYWIQVACPEFTSLCPVTGQPDFADVSIDYIPDRLCVESKSLKFYLSSYRNVHSFNEEVVNRILDDFVRTCAPRKLKVVGRFVPRGGLSLTVTAEFPGETVAPNNNKKR
jgi:7-cyano-7-deazaguanine reductase